MATSTSPVTAPAVGPPVPAGNRPLRRSRTQPLTVAALALTGTAALAAVDPSGTHVPLCPLKAVTGLDCPFCGSLRAVHALTRFDLGRALDHNLLFTASVPLLVAGWAVWAFGTHRLVTRWSPPPSARWAAVVVLTLFAVLRNLEPLAWMASGA